MFQRFPSLCCRVVLVGMIWLAGMTVTCHAMIWQRGVKTTCKQPPTGVMKSVVRLLYSPLHVFGGCGVLLDADTVLTAGHAVDDWKASSICVRHGDQVISVAKITRHPDMKVDLAVIHLAKSFDDVPTMNIWKPPVRKDDRVWMGGYGISGELIEDGKSSIITAAAGLDFASGYRTGRFASGFNRIAKVGSHRNQIVFDPPGKGGEQNEVLPAMFDSGSPVFVQREGAWHLAGITVTVSNRMSPAYGDRSSHESVHASLNWIEKSAQER
ncbi:MAG: trypsin-like serine protease [Rhodopirellula sp. JB044]|uniref:trypsin-like serine protease n=1 Tax=Rhodopirellula sp. JB044 TaxID=3342844 RepID=UPI00370BCC83